MSHQQLGRDNLTQFENSVAEYGTVEKAPVLEGRLMTMMIAPIRDSSKKGGQKKEKPKADPAPSEGSAKQE